MKVHIKIETKHDEMTSTKSYKQSNLKCDWNFFWKETIHICKNKLKSTSNISKFIEEFQNAWNKKFKNQKYMGLKYKTKFSSSFKQSFKIITFY